MGEDGEGALFKKRRGEELELPVAKKDKGDLYVSPGNQLSRKMLEPYGQNELDDISLKNLWGKATKGDEHCPRYTELAIDDPNFRGLAVAKSMKNIVLSITAFMNDDEAGQILDGQIYASVKAECTELLPHLTVLSGGQMRKDGGGRLNAYKAAPVDPSAAEAAAKRVYEWLKKPSEFRSMLKFLSKGGLFYTAFANDKLCRAYIAGEAVTEKDFIGLCLHRLSPAAVDPPDVADTVTNWAKLKKG